MNDNEHVIDHLPAYALGVLDPVEETHTREHLKVCELCRSELEAYHFVSEQLVLAAPPYHPPEELRGKIMQAVTNRDRSPRSVFNWANFISSFQVSPAAWVIMGILVLVLAGSNLLLWREVNVLRSQANEIPFITIGMTGTEVAPLASGMIIINPSGQHGTLVVDGLPNLESTNEYQLWLIRDGLRTSGGTFSVNEQGYASIQIYAHDPLISFPGFGITIEPIGGSPAPTGDRVLGGEL